MNGGANGLDRRKTAVGQITENRYDEYGRLSAVESRYENGSIDKSISYGYDELDRLAKISYGASENETIKYDSWGRIIEKSKNGLVSRFKYDHFGRLVEKREGGSTTKYAYDNYGRRISRVTEKGGEVLDERNTYDKYGRLVKTESNGETVEYVYDKKNRLSGQKMGGVKVEYAYTEYGQVSRKSLIGADGKILSEIKYWYSPSGNITSRLANGKRQEYKYDAKNQLLAVIDAESKLPVESYEYDANGNILQKTIKGETTTYVYDASNQLVKGVMPDGKEVLYAYDAAGRLVLEGEKSYEYGWLDKVTRILEDGKELARFEYHNNNQLAKVVRENGIETFEWDGLALIERNGIKYINEPHAGGGNPILAIGGDEQKTEAIFTDILGTSMGKVSGNGYSAIDKTSFGADTSDKLSFFTGKPYIDGLGYAFLFRNYRADMGKWLSADLIGYPDGWNNFAYCNNDVLINIDLLGCVLYYAQNNSYILNVISNINRYCPNNPNSNIVRLVSDPYSRAYVDSTGIAPGNNPDLKGTLNRFDHNPNHQYYDMPTICLDQDHAANKNYKLDDGNGGTMLGGVSLESIFIHELMHAFNYYYNPNYDNMAREGLEERAMEEANKYRELNNEPIRVSYE